MPRYKPSQTGWICGDKNLRAYFKASMRTLIKWGQAEDFPLCRLPNGCYCVDQELGVAWLLKRSQKLKEQGQFWPPWLDRENRAKHRGSASSEFVPRHRQAA